LGPSMNGESHFAGSRLGYSVWTVKTWRRGSVPVLYTVVSRVIEKTTVYNIHLHSLVLDRMVADARMTGIHTLCFWADCGPCYRSNLFLGTAGFSLPETRRLHTKVYWGVEGHMKGDIDGHFGKLNRALVCRSAARLISSISEVVECWVSNFDSQPDYEGRCIEVYMDHMPITERAKVDCRNVVPSSLPAPVMQCHAWHFRRTDERRATLVGRGPDRLLVTGVEARAVLLPGARCVAARTTQLRLTEKDTVLAEENEDDDCIAEAIKEASALSFLTKEHLGWRCSYRKDTPEDPETMFPKVRRRLRRKRLYHEIEHLLPEVHRHRPITQGGASAAARLRQKAELDGWRADRRRACPLAVA
jgi:hypothetical protein